MIIYLLLGFLIGYLFAFTIFNKKAITYTQKAITYTDKVVELEEKDKQRQIQFTNELAQTKEKLENAYANAHTKQRIGFRFNGEELS